MRKTVQLEVFVLIRMYEGSLDFKGFVPSFHSRFFLSSLFSSSFFARPEKFYSNLDAKLGTDFALYLSGFSCRCSARICSIFRVQQSLQRSIPLYVSNPVTYESMTSQGLPPISRLSLIF